MNIEPTITPAPQPEWQEIKVYIYRSGDDAYVHAGFSPDFLATVVIPSSADCERRAKVEAARDAIISAARLIRSTEGVRYIVDVMEACDELRKLEQENQP